MTQHTCPPSASYIINAARPLKLPSLASSCCHAIHVRSDSYYSEASTSHGQDGRDTPPSSIQFNQHTPASSILSHTKYKNAASFPPFLHSGLTASSLKLQQHRRPSMPSGGTSYLATMGRRSFSYHRLKKPPTAAPFSPPHLPATMMTTPTIGLDQQEANPPCATAAAIEESYRSYYRVLVARGRRRRQQQQPWRGNRRPRRRLRVWGALARALRRRAAAAGARVRASVARVARRLKEGRPYVGDLFAGNYMFLQVSPTMAGADGRARGDVVPFAEYYYGCKARARAAADAGAGAVQMHRAAAAAAVLYKV